MVTETHVSGNAWHVSPINIALRSLAFTHLPPQCGFPLSVIVSLWLWAVLYIYTPLRALTTVSGFVHVSVRTWASMEPLRMSIVLFNESDYRQLGKWGRCLIFSFSSPQWIGWLWDIRPKLALWSDSFFSLSLVECQVWIEATAKPLIIFIQKHPSADTYGLFDRALIRLLGGGVSRVLNGLTTILNSVNNESAALGTLKGHGSDILVM